MKILTKILILVTAYLSFTHGWSGLTMKPGSKNMLSEMGVSTNLIYFISALTFAVGVFIFFPQTFLVANLVSAAMILLIMTISIMKGNFKVALIEIPFLLLPLVMIWLRHPFATHRS